MGDRALPFPLAQGSPARVSGPRRGGLDVCETLRPRPALGGEPRHDLPLRLCRILVVQAEQGVSQHVRRGIVRWRKAQSPGLGPPGDIDEPSVVEEPFQTIDYVPGPDPGVAGSQRGRTQPPPQLRTQRRGDVGVDRVLNGSLKVRLDHRYESPGPNQSNHLAQGLLGAGEVGEERLTDDQVVDPLLPGNVSGVRLLERQGAESGGLRCAAPSEDLIRVGVEAVDSGPLGQESQQEASQFSLAAAEVRDSTGGIQNERGAQTLGPRAPPDVFSEQSGQKAQPALMRTV